MYNSKLGLIEFENFFMEHIDSINITSITHMQENEEFYSGVIFKIYDLYQRDGSDYSILDLVKLFHIFLTESFKNNTKFEKCDYEITLF